MNPKDKAYQRAYGAFRERLIKARKDAELTQVEVNTRMGKPHSFISKCELGERRVDFVELQLLAKIYGKNLSFFITLDWGATTEGLNAAHLLAAAIGGIKKTCKSSAELREKIHDLIAMIIRT